MLQNLHTVATGLHTFHMWLHRPLIITPADRVQSNLTLCSGPWSGICLNQKQTNKQLVAFEANSHPNFSSKTNFFFWSFENFFEGERRHVAFKQKVQVLEEVEKRRWSLAGVRTGKTLKESLEHGQISWSTFMIGSASCFLGVRSLKICIIS
jgi:hypothetical protein